MIVPSPVWVPFPALTHFQLGCMQVDLSCSPCPLGLFRQSRLNPAQKLLLTFLFWLLLLNGLFGVNQQRCTLLQFNIWPTLCWCKLFPLQKCLKDNVAIVQLLCAPLLPHPDYILKGTFVWANVIHVTQWNRIGHCINYFRSSHLLFPLSYYLGSWQCTSSLLPLHSGIAAGSRRSLPSASRSV